MERTTVYLPVELRTRMAEYSQRTGETQSHVLREAVAMYLDRAGRPVPRSIGAGNNPNFNAENTRDWLRENWHPE
jgi:hypothetical protein